MSCVASIYSYGEFDHKIPKELMINFDQTLLSYITVGNTTLEFFGAGSVAVKGKGKGK